jgi:hypothetical protein
MERDLADAHPGMQHDREATEVRELERDFSLEPRIDEAGRGVDQEGQAPNAAPTFHSRHEIARYGDAFERRPEDEVAGPEDQRFPGRHANLVVEVRRGCMRIDGARPVSRAEKHATEAQIDARWLDLHVRLVKRIDDQVAPREALFQLAIREDHGTRSTPSATIWPAARPPRARSCEPDLRFILGIVARVATGLQERVP